jgi:hypothetical protein
MAGVKATDEQKRRIQTHMLRLKSRLTSTGERQAIAIELAKLFAAFPAQDQSDSPAELRMEAYFEGLHGIPAWAIAEARGRIVRGETVLDTRFAPTPPQLAVQARVLLEPLKADLAKLERIALAAGSTAETTAEERARVTAGFDKLKGDMRNVQP